MKFGEYVRTERLQAGYTQRQLADAMGISHVYLGEVERGVRGPFTEDRMNMMFDALPGMRRVLAEALRKKTCAKSCKCVCHTGET